MPHPQQPIKGSMNYYKNLEKELASAKDHIKRLEEHIKTLEEGGDCADVTETFWNIHNNEVYEMEKKHKKEIKALTGEINKKIKENKKVDDENECYELCLETFANVRETMNEEGIRYLINLIKEDIDKRWKMNGSYWSQSYYLERNIPHTFNILFPLALKMALNIYRNEEGDWDIPIDHNGDLEYYDEEGAYNHIKELIDEYNDESNEEIIRYNEEEHPEAKDLIELIEETIEYNERDLIYLPSVSQNGKRMIILMNLDGSL